MEKKEFSTYSVIPTEILLNKELSSTAKLLYGLISSLTNEKGHCWASNKYLGNLLSISETRVSLLIKELVDIRLIESIVKEGYKREIKLMGVLTKVKGGVKEKLKGALTKVKYNNIIEYNKLIYVNQDLQEEVSTPLNGKKIATNLSDDSFSSKDYLETMLADKRKHIQIIAKYFKSTKQDFPTKKAIQDEIRRWSKDASTIAQYPDEKLARTFEYVSKEFPDVWNLSTIRKYISKIK